MEHRHKAVKVQIGWPVSCESAARGSHDARLVNIGTGKHTCVLIERRCILLKQLVNGQYLLLCRRTLHTGQSDDSRLNQRAKLLKSFRCESRMVNLHSPSVNHFNAVHAIDNCERRRRRSPCFRIDGVDCNWQGMRRSCRAEEAEIPGSLSLG